LALGKEAFAECFFFALGKETSLLRAVYRTLFFAECKGFAKCFLFGSRQRLRRSAKKRIPVVKAALVFLVFMNYENTMFGKMPCQMSVGHQ
jgi:hypothetical protein